jgi:hypothetical protein
MHLFSANRRISAEEGEAIFRIARTEQEMQKGIELLKRLSPSQA